MRTKLVYMYSVFGIISLFSLTESYRTAGSPDCGSSLSVRNGNVSYTQTTTFGSSASIACNTGYETSKATIKCLGTGSWEKTNCTIKDCGSSLTVSNGNVSYTKTTTFGSSAVIDCNTGYETIKATIKCLGTGSWEKTNCTIKDCGSSLIVSNGNVSYTKTTTFGSSAAIACNTGYETSKATIKCLGTGSWEKTNCTIKDCGPLNNLNISNSKDKLLFTDTKYGSSAAVTCITGYYDENKPQMKGVSSTLITCFENGTWANVPNCVRKDCGNLTDIKITNAVHRRLHTNTKFESMADIDCDDGYFIRGRIQIAGISTQSIACSDTGTWINMQECVPKDCGSLDKLNLSNAKNRSMVNGTTLYTSLANITCDEGYKELRRSQVQGITSTVVRCNENGTWANLPKCVRKDCGKLENIRLTNVNERHYINGTVFSSIASISCDDGFQDKYGDQTERISTTIITCSETGDWTNLPTCVRKDCGPLSAPANGYVIVAQNSTVYGTIATYKCDPGFFMAGLETSRCMASGHWSNNSTHCQIKDCGLLVPPKDGFVVTLNGTNFGASSEFRCNPGYTLYGDYFTTCLSNGTWQKYHVTCILQKKAMPTICFSCDGMSSPEYCDKVEHCQGTQICYTESYQTDYGKVFRSGCMDEQKCYKEENITSNSVCVECCTGEMCNNKGCGNTDFPSREHRGPMCFDCQHIGDINSCLKVTMCASDQVCSIEKQQWGDTYHYKLGCTHHLCNSLSHQIPGTLSSCHACCRDDYCNRNCTSSSSPGEIFVG